MQFKFVFLNVFAIYLFLLSNSFTFIHINFEADQSYFLAEVNNITKKNFDKQLASIPPVMSLGPKYTISEDEMYSMRL